jgi:AsmA protein
LLALAALLALLAVCAVLLRLLFDPNDYRGQVELAFNERTGRVLELEGSLGLRLLPRLAVSTGPFSISDRPGSAEGDFLTARDARIGLALLPLLRRRIELGELVLVEPVVALRIDAEGRDNWSDLFDRPEAAEPAEEGAPPNVADGADVSIAAIAIVGGRLSFEDARRARRLQFADLEVDAGPFARNAPVAVHASFALEREGAQPLRSVVDGRLERPRPGEWTAENLVVEVERPAHSEEREPIRGRIEAARVTANLDARRYSAPELRYRLGEARGEASLEARQGADGLTIEGPVTLERIDLRKLLTGLGFELPRFKDPDAPGDFEFKAALRYGPRFALRDLVAVLDGTRLTGSLGFGSDASVPLEFELRGDRIVLDDYLPATQAAPAATKPARAAAGRDRLRKLDVRGRLSFGRLSCAGMELSNVDGRIAIRDGGVELDPLKASVFGGTSQTRARYEFASDVPRLTLDQRLVGVDATEVLGQLMKQRRLSGRGTLTAQLSGAGRDGKALLASLAGPFDVQVIDGRFSGVDLWAEIEKAVAAARGAAPVPPSGTAYTPFDRFEAQGRLEGTVIRNERFDVANPSMRAHGSGTVDYGTGALDLELTARLLEAPEGEIAGISLDRIVGVDVPLTVRGSMSAPKVRPDVARLLEAAARQQLKQQGEDIEKKLKEKLEDKLKELLGQ